MWPTASPGATGRDRERRPLPREIFTRCAELGVLGFLLPVEHGGLGLGEALVAPTLARREGVDPRRRRVTDQLEREMVGQPLEDQPFEQVDQHCGAFLEHGSNLVCIALEPGHRVIARSIEWLDAHPQYEVKYVSTTVGELTGKLKEPHMICQVWV